MGLTDNQRYLIMAVAQNDIQSAKKCAIACVEEDSTQKNKYFCNKYKSILQSSSGNMMELPYDLKSILCVEDVSHSFKEERYYLSKREKIAFDNIIKMKKVSNRLMEIGIPYLNSTLLYGESGTGKTTFGRFVAHKTGLPFCYLNFSGLVDSCMGNTSKNINKAFNYVISNPCVFMLDEIDCISIRRSDSGDSGVSSEMARITISLMQEFDKLTNDIIILGATNRIDRIDKALLRRFTIKHEVKRLEQKEKIDMIMKFFRDVGYETSDFELNDLSELDRTQSELLNSMIVILATHFMKEQELAND